MRHMTIASPKQKNNKGRKTSVPKGAFLDKHQETWLQNNYDVPDIPKLSLNAHVYEQVITVLRLLVGII